MNKVLIFGLCDLKTEAAIIWANVKEGYTFKIKVANHYRFAGLGFDKTGMGASCARFNARITPSIRHGEAPSFHANLIDL